MRSSALLLAFLVGSATGAVAIGVPYVGDIVHAGIEASLVASPDGEGTPFDEALAFGAIEVDMSIQVFIVDAFYDPIVLFPFEDMWLQFADDSGSANSCWPPGGYFLADYSTDADGMTEFVMPLRGGGWSEGPATFYLNGWPAVDPNWINWPPIPLRMNSPDIDGDLVVNITDVAYFVQDFGSYHYRSDFYWDGVVNLSDLALFVPRLGAQCP